jgi:ABC-type branched-subunit amino acid transport system substrate-binding protein
MKVSGGRSFPPGIGWLPALAAILLALVAASIAVAPNYGNRIVGQRTIEGAVGGGGGGTSTSGTPQPGAGGVAAVLPGQQTTVVRGGAGGGIDCAARRNGGATAPGVTATQIHVASTIVTTGIGSGFLKEAADGMRAALDEVNSAGGICGRTLTFDNNLINDDWQPSQGNAIIQNWINSGNVFALVGEPDSEGLGAAITSGTIDRGGIPVVGTDGMLANQYFNNWVWPVAASTVSNMHIIAKYAADHYSRSGVPPTFGIVYDTRYKFGREGAQAFDQEVRRETGHDIQGFGGAGCAGQTAYCGIDPNSTDYSNEITAFNSSCSGTVTAKCDVVVMLLEPGPMENWMSGEADCRCHWYSNLFGGEPLFDDKMAQNCAGCGQGHMTVWTGYRPAIQPFDSEKPVYTYCQSLRARNASDDCHNEFTQGAYLGTRLFISAVQRLAVRNLPLTRENLRDVLNGDSFDLGLAGPFHFGGSLPRQANLTMAAFSENYSGSFNGWSYDNTGFLPDPSPGRDLR